MLSVIMLSVIMVNVIMLSVIMLCVIMLSVIRLMSYAECCGASYGAQEGAKLLANLQLG